MYTLFQIKRKMEPKDTFVRLHVDTFFCERLPGKCE